MVDSDDHFTNITNVLLYWKYIRENYIKPYEAYRIFITTDTRSVELDALKEFGADKVVTINGTYAHLDREANLEPDCSKVDKTFLDFHALQYCDRAVISQSGFGKLGLWNRPEPNKDLIMFSKSQTFVKVKCDDELVMN